MDGNWITTWTDRVGGNGGEWEVAAIATDGLGQLYAADETGVHRLTANGTTDQSWPVTQAHYSDFAIAPAGNFYVSSGTVSIIDSNGQELGTIGYTPTANGHLFGESPQWMGTNGNGILAVLQRSEDAIGSLHLFDVRTGDWITTSVNSRSHLWSEGMAIWKDRIYVLDFWSKQIVRYSMKGEKEAVFDSLANLGQSIDIDSQGRIFVASGANDQIEIINPNGTGPLNSMITLQSGASTIKSDGLAIDPQDQLYITNSSCLCVGRFTADGAPLNDFGTFISRVYPFDAVQIDSAGIIYVRELSGSLSKYDRDGNRLSRLPIGGFVDKDASIYQIDQWGRILIHRSINPPTDSPIGTINHLSSISGVIEANDVLTITAMGQDSDATDIIRRYQWASDQDQILGESTILTLTANTLQPGEHTIRLRVQDDEGKWSPPIAWIVKVLTDLPAIYLPLIQTQ